MSFAAISTLAIFSCLAPAGQAQEGRPQFEVASVKPVMPTGSDRERARARMFGMMRPGSVPMPSPGRVRIEGLSLRQLIATAYRVRADQVAGPSWMDDVYFEVDAKMPEGSPAAQANEMLQGLLGERFGLEVHREDREASGFVLLAGKGAAKLEEFLPPARPLSPEEMQERQKQWMEARLKAASRAGSGAAAPGRSRTSWTGVTMTELAERLTPMAGGPVSDQTGLTGRYNLVLETWQSTDDDSGQNVFQAVAKAGLELVPRKVRVDVVAIDRVSKTPTAN